MSTPSAPSVYQLQNQPGADMGAYQGIQDLSKMPNYAQQTYNQYQPAFNGLNTPSGYNPAQTVNYANQQSTALQNAGNQLMNTAYDPQNQLYNRTAQQLTDQTRAGLEARGLDSTPYGAGVEGQTLGNFNIDWQNQQLNRQLQGLQGLNTASTGIDQAQQLAMGVPQLQSGIMGQLQQAGNLAYTQPQMTIQDFLSYLSGGTSKDQSATQNWQAQSQANSQGMAGLGSLFGTLFSKVPMFSDERLKTNVEHIGELSGGLPVYEYEYIWGGPRHVGVMAQEAEKVRPSAVKTDATGFKTVDYAELFR